MAGGERAGRGRSGTERRGGVLDGPGAQQGDGEQGGTAGEEQAAVEQGQPPAQAAAGRAGRRGHVPPIR